MKKHKHTIIYLIGNSGVGKYTISTELAKAGYVICDNQLINNPIFALLNYDGFARIPEFAWSTIKKIRDNVFDFIIKEQNNSYVLTNVLYEDNLGDRNLCQQVEQMAAQRNSLFVPIKLLISEAENLRRIQESQRRTRWKSIDPQDVYNKKEIINIVHPNLLELEVTNLTAKEAALQCLGHVAAISKQVDKIVCAVAACSHEEISKQKENKVINITDEISLLPITFKVVNYGAPEYKEAVLLRENVLRKPLGSKFSEEEVLAEKDHIHIVGVDGLEIVATAVLVLEGKECKMQRVAVKESLRGQNIGSKLLGFCEQYAKKQGVIAIYCHARDAAISFYLKNNYLPEGKYFQEDNIAHLKMNKIIAFDFIVSSAEDKEYINDNIVAFNISHVPATQKTQFMSFNYCLNDQGVIIAGINSILYLWGILYIDVLFVDQSYRNLGLGSYLLKKVEHEAKMIGAILVHLDTFDFQAKDFYLKHGYEIFGILDECPAGHKRIYFKKRLENNTKI